MHHLLNELFNEKIIMPKYIIERDIANAGALSAQDLQGI